MNYGEIKRTIVKLPGSRGVDGILYEPRIRGAQAKIGMVLEHSDESYYEFEPALEFPKRGFIVYALQCDASGEHFDKKLKKLGKAVDFVKSIPGIEKVILIGHSGGATLMSAYQNIAENGCKTFQGEEKIIRLDDMELTPADGVMFLDSNYGNGAMTLLSLDPAILDESTGKKRDASLDLFNPENGYEEGNCHYSEEFKQRFWKGQADRMNRLIDYAQERVSAIEKGEGLFVDDEPMTIPGATQFAPNNKLFPQVPSYLSHTKREWPLIHKDGSVTTQIVPCVRKARGGRNTSGIYDFSCLQTTVKSFLKNSAVRVNAADFHYDESDIYGIDWNSSYTCTVGNVEGISVPILALGMTGSYEYLAAEFIFEHAKKCSDISIGFVEGASHNFVPETSTEDVPGQWGDTVKSTFDYAAGWLNEKFA
jgi:hypothetical protein